MKTLNLQIGFVALALAASVALAQQKMDAMENMAMAKKPVASAQATHAARATVKKVDEKAGVVTLAHEPVPSLNWPAMTMGFKVKDKTLMKKLGDGKKVEVEFTKDGDDYVLTAVK